METPKILIVVHDADDSLRYQEGEGFDGYLIEVLIRGWKAMGYAVQVMHGITQHVPADLVIPHINLTVVPQAYQDFFRTYPHVMNRHVVDISKSKISSHLVQRNDTYPGAVIVKTDRNHGGLPEQRLFPPSRLGQSTWAGVARRVLSQTKLGCAARRFLDRFDRRDPRHVSWRSVQSLDPDAYPIFPSIHDVPEAVFENRNLVVEKFLPEIADGDTCARWYYFCGSSEINFLFRSKEREGVPAYTSYHVEEVPVPTEMYALREQFRFDYGKFDYVLRDGKVVLFDVNRTPNSAALRKWGLIDKVAARLVDGIKPQLVTEETDRIAPSLLAT